MKTKPAATHTPTPWKSEVHYIYSAESSRLLIAETNKNQPNHLEDAAFIVLAVNAHDELRCELKRLHKKEHPKFGDKTCWTCLAIAKAEGGK